MMFTGTLIEDLIATVERVQKLTRAETEITADLESWFLSSQDDTGSNNKFLGAA